MSTVHNVNLPSTFITSGDPAVNYSAAEVFYVGTLAGWGTCNGLLQIPDLPTCTTLTSALLQLRVSVKTGEAPSTVNVQKVTAPSPLDTTTVTYSTPGLTISPTIEATKSIVTTDKDTNIQIDVTSLITSYYSSPFPGIALTCADGSLVLFGSDVSANPPVLILACDESATTTDVKIAGHYVDEATETLTAPLAVDTTSAVRNISERTHVNFFATNTGSYPAAVGLELSIDGTNYFKLTQGALAAGATGSYAPPFYAKYARLYFHSNDASNTTTLKIDYIAQA